MDVQAIRERMFTGFKPKTQDFATPYLEGLDGELMLQGLSGKQRIALEEQASEETIDQEGKATSKVNPQKFIALIITACLRSRATGEPIFSAVDTLGVSGNGDGLSAEMESGPYLQLMKDVSRFVGIRSAEETKNASEPTGDGSATTSSPQDSEGPLTNSSPESTQQS